MNKEKFENLISNAGRVIICVHDYPDPDAMGAAFGLKLLIETAFDSKSAVIIGSGVSHPQNRTMVNALNVPMMTPKEWEEAPKDPLTEVIMWVDFNLNSGNNKSMQGSTPDLMNPSWIIDHHVDKQLTNGWHIESVGSSCTLIAEYMQEFGFTWDLEDPEHQNVATAMMLGIMVDTNNLLSQAVTQRDLKAFDYLKRYYSQDMFNLVMDYELNHYFYDLLAKAHATQAREGSIVVLCLGYLKAERRDAIPFVADLWRRCKDINTVIAFAVIDNSVTGSVRMKGSSDMRASDLAREIFKSPDSGGHAHMAGGTAKFGPFFELDLLDDEAKREFLHAINKIIVSRAKNFAQLDE